MDILHALGFRLGLKFRSPGRARNRGQIGLRRNPGRVQDQRHRAVAQNGGPGVFPERLETSSQGLDHHFFRSVEGAHHQTEGQGTGIQHRNFQGRSAGPAPALLTSGPLIPRLRRRLALIVALTKNGRSAIRQT